MKRLATIIIAFFFLSTFAFSQNVNWNSIDDDYQFMGVFGVGYDYGLIGKMGFAHRCKIKNDALLSLNYSSPMGNRIFDDFKITYGIQTVLYKKDNFVFSNKLFANVKRHQTSLVRLIGIGGDFSLCLGYYKPNWFVAVKSGYETTFSTHIKNGKQLVKYYPEIQDGWYKMTSGYFHHSLILGITLSESVDLNLKVGLTNAKGKDVNSILPYTIGMGFNKSF